MFINKYNKYKKKYLKLKNQFAGTKTLEYELFEVKIHCILIKEDCREAYLMYNMIYMTECFNYIEREFSDLEIFDATLCLRKEEKKSDDESDDESDDDMPKLKSIFDNVVMDTIQIKYYISKKKLTCEDINTNAKIGALLGYKCPYDIEESTVNYTFGLRTIDDKYINLFNYMCSIDNAENNYYAEEIITKIKAALIKYPDVYALIKPYSIRYNIKPFNTHK